MKIHGEKAGLYEEVVVFPRPGNKAIVFKVKAVADPSGYEKVCPKPIPPNRTLPGGRVVPFPEEKNYKNILANWVVGQYNWIYIESLRETEGLEWEKVVMDKPETYSLWMQELEEFGLTITEQNYLFGKIQTANALSNEKLDDARDNFLLRESLANVERSLHLVEPSSIPSGDSANASGSDQTNLPTQPSGQSSM